MNSYTTVLYLVPWTVQYIVVDWQRTVWLQAVMESPHGGPFALPVSSELVPDYHDIIKSPMDLGTVSEKLRQRTYPALGTALA